MRRPTRRELAALLAAMPIAAQNPLLPAQPPPPAANTLEKVNGDVREAGEKLRAVSISMNVEPAFQFKA